MKKIAVLSIHGMGDTDKDYHAELVEKLSEKVGLDDWDRNIHFEKIYYQDILQNNQEEIWMRMNQFTLDSNRLRRLMLYGFADAGSLEYPSFVTLGRGK